jgi:cytochrome c-type biogenesis protein CcmF
MSELGYTALRLALVVSAVGSFAGVYAGVSRRREWRRLAERAVLLVMLFATVAIGALFHAFATLDFQLGYVAGHVARAMDIEYRIAALWGGQAGSLLLWLWLLTIYSGGAILVNRRGHPGLTPWVSATLLVNCLFFLVLLNFVSNPFEKLPPGEVLSDGSGLNPLLEHPAMLIHPLLLYIGMVGFAVPFAFGLAAMLSGQLGTVWMRTTRRWTLFSWFFLSIGILMGGRWAYEVLGWGGYWAWDPVENASLMPWLAGTAFLHSVMVQEKRDMLKIWNLILIGLTYSLCLFGTMLTRSGLVQSVHSFAQTKVFGLLFLGYVLLTVLVFFGVLISRRQALRSTNRLESILSRESGFLLNNWIFMVILAVVLWGTMFPKISDWLTGTERMIGPLWFNQLNAPLALLLLLLTGVGPLIAWRRASRANLRKQFLWPGVAAVLTAGALLAWFRAEIGFFPLATWSLGSFVVGTIFQEYFRALRSRMRGGKENLLEAFGTLMRKNQRRYGGYVVHLGVVFILVGIAGAAFNEERLENVRPGGAVEIDGYRLEYRTASPIPKQHYGGAVARIALYQDGRPLATMTPEKRMYWLEQQPVSIPSVYSTLREDLYVVLTAIESNGSATLKIYRNPLVNWLWIGGYTFALGTLVCLWPNSQRRSG